MFETIAHGIEFERRTERRRVTPGWWVHHMAARTLLQILVTAIRAFVDEVRAELIEPLIADTGTDAALVTIRILDSLELVHRPADQVHAPRVGRAVLVPADPAPSAEGLPVAGSLRPLRRRLQTGPLDQATQRLTGHHRRHPPAGGNVRCAGSCTASPAAACDRSHSRI